MRAASVTCLKCDYDLRALSEHRCPECGGDFDPDDARTFRASRKRTIAEEARLIALAAYPFPLLAVGLLNLAWLAARLELGRWPEPHVDRASRVGGALDLILPMAGVSFMFVLPALLVCALAGLLAVAASTVTKRGIMKSLRTFAASCALCIGTIGYAIADPQGILHWLFWDM